MINEPLYKRTVDVLYNAYMNDTLVHGYCTACAVGNLVAAANGYCMTRSIGGTYEWKDGYDFVRSSWTLVHMVSRGQQKIRKVDKMNCSYSERLAIEELESTGYTIEQTAAIELAFETAPKGKNKEDRMFNGLMAVIDCLDKIHEVDVEQSNNSKNLFVEYRPIREQKLQKV